MRHLGVGGGTILWNPPLGFTSALSCTLGMSCWPQTFESSAMIFIPTMRALSQYPATIASEHSPR